MLHQGIKVTIHASVTQGKLYYENFSGQKLRDTVPSISSFVTVARYNKLECILHYEPLMFG